MSDDENLNLEEIPEGPPGGDTDVMPSDLPEMDAGGGGGGGNGDGPDGPGDGGDDEGPRTAKDLEAVFDIPVQVSAVLGKTTLQVNQLLKLGRGAVVELDRKVGEAVDIYVNNRLVARGEVVIVDERLGVTMTEIIKVDHS